MSKKLFEENFQTHEIANLTNTVINKLDSLDEEALTALVLDLTKMALEKNKNDDDVLIWIFQFSDSRMRQKILANLEDFASAEDYSSKVNDTPDFNKMDKNLALIDQILQKHSQEKSRKSSPYHKIKANISKGIQRIIK